MVGATLTVSGEAGGVAVGGVAVGEDVVARLAARQVGREGRPMGREGRPTGRELGGELGVDGAHLCGDRGIKSSG